MKRTIIGVLGVDNPGRIFSDMAKKYTEHTIPERWLRHGFWKDIKNHGLWLRRPGRDSRVLSMISAEEAEEEVIHHLFAAYVFQGTFDEFLVRFCKVPMGTDVKRCPNPECNQYFTSSPQEFFKHVVECTKKSERKNSKPLVMYDDCCCCSCC